jgi:cytochrome c-type protein NapB
VTQERHDTSLVRRGAFIGTVVLAMAAVIAGIDMVAMKGAADTVPPVVSFIPRPEPIPEEAGVFRTRVAELAGAGDAERRSTAHPRTLAAFRALRAYPGAPPRVPHGLTAGEFRATQCNTCHERGGFVARFAAYAPVTPHPEQSACLQCHATDAALVGIALPDGSGDAICRQCHDPGSMTAAPGARPATGLWPVLSRTADGLPPSIPHDLQLRGNCLACHMGPAAVAEIRTTHPERSDCRQCHVTLAADEAPFERPAPATPRRSGGEP